MPSTPTWCRLSDCAAALIAEGDGTTLSALRPDPEGLMVQSAPCSLCQTPIHHQTGRILRPRRRIGDRWEDTSWEVAIREIGGRLKEIRRQSGVQSLATYVGAPVGLSSAGTVRSLAWTLAVGSPNLYTPLSTSGGAWLRATELMLGHPVPLQSDIGRAHYVLLLGANQEAQGWGPLQAGRSWGAELAAARKTRGAKLVVADPRRTATAAGADLHLPIRPGTEVYFLLGLIAAILDNDWTDQQYVRDYCAGRAELVDAVAPWTVERCAQACGVSAEAMGGVALKFSRAAMAVAHKSPQALNNVNSSLTAWALLVLHALTANLLRPGGLYENGAIIDQHALGKSLASDRAPHTRIGDYPLLLLQAPAAVFADEVLVPGDNSVRALVSLFGDPARELPGGPRVAAALSALDLLVCLDVADTETTRLAHWVLPGTHAWERADVHLLGAGIHPVVGAQVTPALVAPVGEARDEARVLADLLAELGPSLRSPFGAAIRLRGGRFARGDIDPMLASQFGRRGTPSLETVRGCVHGWYGGEVDRSLWQVHTPENRIQLLPETIRTLLLRLEAPTAPPDLDRWLLTSAARDRALRPFDRAVDVDPGVTLHPSAGFAEGSRVRIRTLSGEVEATVHLDEGLRPDVVDLPAGYRLNVGTLIPTDHLDPLVGTPAWNGLACALYPV